MRRIVAVFMAAVPGLCAPAHADMGRIHTRSESVTVSEAAQKAIILHNLTEEVLVLGTDLKASEKTGIVRFIPFPAEPTVGLAPDDAFETAASLIKKYGLKYQEYSFSKGGEGGAASQGVEIRLNQKLGAHDMTVIKVNEVSAFRAWVNGYFEKKGLMAKDEYPAEEGIVADYVRRGFVHFAVDFAEVSTETRFIEPVSYRFKTKQLYYPLLTSNSFGGEGSIELIVIAPTTLCTPGNTPFDPYSGAAYRETRPEAQRPYNQRPLCFNLPLKASTSALLAGEEKAIKGLSGEPGGFFGKEQAIIQVISYTGKYSFKDDILADAATGLKYALEGLEDDPADKRCALKGETGPCKGMFQRYFFDPASRSCKGFFWGGCGETQPFETEEECARCR
ncbi:MAG: DUF2330 domain-containing protein [Elusimicrobia bacterium]|nr:DUF2330 domain-containing protein [Elusimicrobiota bacterium]